MFIIVFTGALTTQCLYFLLVLAGPPRLESADLIIVFQGSPERARTAYHLIDIARAPALVISPATDQQLAAYDHAYRPTRPFDKILEQQARTTFENALFTGAIVKKRGFKSAILVTSWDHMPRAYLLLRMMLVGSQIRVQTHSSATGKLSRQNWHRHTVGWKMIYNEMIETWGSLLELAKYGIQGEPSATATGKSGAVNWLKKRLLFDIDSKAIAAVSS